MDLKLWKKGKAKLESALFFFLKNFNFAHFSPVFKLKKCPFFARFFLKMSLFEEFFTLFYCTFLTKLGGEQLLS